MMKDVPYENKISQPLRRLLFSLLAQSMVFFLFFISTAAHADSVPTPTPVPPGGLQTTTSLSLPPGYEVLMQGSRPCRLRGQSPLIIYSNDDRFQQVFQHATETWNSAARILGLTPFFARTGNPSEADVTLDWSSRGLPPTAAGAVWWSSGEGVERVKGITMEPNTRLPEGNLAEILMQELGHVTGLGHSQDSRDIQYQAIHRQRYPSLSSVHLTERDMQALAWLYSQRNFVPIVGLRQIP
jgi:hypothetical protein